MNLRTLGVRGKNLPTKRTLAVVSSDFAIAGLLGFFERSFNKAFEVKSPEEFNEIFGNQINPSAYGPDAVKGFFDNAVGVASTLIIQSMFGFSGGSIDAVVASREKADGGADADAYKVESAYQEELEYGVSGNRTGTKFTQAPRFSTLSAGGVATSGVEEAVLDSVSGIRVGDIARFDGDSIVYQKITEIVESENKIKWVGDLGATLAVDDVVDIPGFIVQTFRKSSTGIETEVQTDLGQVVCSPQPEVAEFFVDNIHSSNNWVKITGASASGLGDRFPVNDSAVVYPTNGEDGTTSIDVVYQDFFLKKFDNLPVRFVANPESTNEAVQKAIETYNKGRTEGDTPLTIFNIVEDRTKGQLVTIGNNFQRSDEVSGIIPANWLKVSDPFNSSQNAPLRHVPNVGHIMGLWIRTIGILGVHYVPATGETPIFGVEGVVGDQFLDDRDRTDIAEAGINVIQQRSGIGTILANCRTPSTATAFAFGNGLVMRNFIKVSSVDSLKPTENTPNSANRLRSSKMAIVLFLNKLWLSGSTGDVPEGETFGQTEEEDRTLSTTEEAFQVSLDPIKNSKANLQLGRRDIDTYFTYPAPGESIVIGVGILLR